MNPNTEEALKELSRSLSASELITYLLQWKWISPKAAMTLQIKFDDLEQDIDDYKCAGKELESQIVNEEVL